MTGHIQVALARKTLTPRGLQTFGAAAAAPLVVLIGGIVATYGGTQVTALPLMFLAVGTVVALLGVGYTAMAREVPHAAAYYAILARGLGRNAGVGGGAVAMLGYNAIQISLYGLLGYTLSGLLGGIWWVWTLIALAVVALFGIRAIAVSTWLLATVLCLSAVVIFLFVVASLVQPEAGRLTWEGFSAPGLIDASAGGALALCLAAYFGQESIASYGEEAVDNTAVGRSYFRLTLALTSCYALVAFAMGIAVGPQNVSAIAADPDGGLPFSIMEARIGGFMTPVTQAILVFAIITSMVAFHNVIARYAFAMGREGVLPAALAHSGNDARISAPVGGSVLQTVIAAVMIAGFAIAGADPLATMFTWLSTLGALGLLSLLIASSIASLVYFSRAPRRSAHRSWPTTTAALVGITLGGVVLAAMVLNMGSLLRAEPGSLMPLLLPALVVGAALLGMGWAGHLRRFRPDVYNGISYGRPAVHAVPDNIHINF